MKKNKKYRTDFLYSTTNYLTGVGSIFNLAGSFYNFNSSKSGLEADFKAISSDWGVVGNDIEDAIENFNLENKDKLQLELDE